MPARSEARTGMSEPRSWDVAVVGGGTIGTAIAWRCAQRGCSVVLVDPVAEDGAWHTAAGMLAPVTELHYTETSLLHLGMESLRRYPAFVAELEAATGLSCRLVTTGTLAAAWDAADLRALHDLQAFATRLGVEARLLTGRELRALEPALAPGLPGGMLVPGDHQVDPRLLHGALVTAAQDAGVHVAAGRAAVRVEGGAAVGVDVAGQSISAGHVVVAAGAWSGLVPGVPPEAAAPVRPVKGQTLRLRLTGAPRISRVVRAHVKGSPVYLVPRADGEIVIGASSEEAGFDVRPRAGAVYELLRDAQSLLPELGEAVLAEVCTGLRPGSPDNAPVVGPGAVRGLVHASGHHRNGILLTPVTADAVAEYVTTGVLPHVMAPFTPARFDGARVGVR
jgi:glycine oxidase